MSLTSGIYSFASGVWDDLGSPSSTSITSISGWAKLHIGDLNVLLDTEFVTDSGVFTPPLGNTETAIFTNLYKVKYFQQRTVDSINGIIDNDTVDWSQLKEGDSLVVRTNRGELIKLFRQLQKDAKADVNELITYYKSNLSSPVQVAGDDAPLSASLN